MVYTNCINFENNENYKKKQRIHEIHFALSSGARLRPMKKSGTQAQPGFSVKFEKIMIDDEIEYNDEHVQ